MLVSIITPTFNSEHFIEKTANSIVNQTYSDWEWIIVDDLSTDNTVHILKKLEKTDPRIKCFFFTKNQGAGPARNKAIEQAKGKYIAFIDSDDLWTTDKLALQIEFMERNKYAFSHTAYGFIDENDKIIKGTLHVGSTPVTYQMMLKRNHIGCLTAIYDQEILGKVFMPDLRQKQDYACWLSTFKKGVRSYPLDKELALYRIHSKSATNNKFNLIYKHWLLLTQFEKINWVAATYYTFCWGLNGLKKFYL